MFRCDNSDEIKGGILVYTSSKLSVNIPKSKKLMNLKSAFKECLLLDIHVNGETVLFGAVYRKGASTAQNNKILRDIIDISSNNYEKVLYCGDVNFPSIKWPQNIVEDTNFSPAMTFYDCLRDSFKRL